MSWVSIGSVGTGQMPSEREWILFCYELALAYLNFKCGKPPPGCTLGVTWHDHDLAEYPSLGVDSESEPPWNYIRKCEAALERFDGAIDWATIKPEVDSATDDDSIEENDTWDVEVSDEDPDIRRLEWNLNEEVERYFDKSSRCKEASPLAVIIMGGVAVGKTTLRNYRFSEGYVLIDAGDIFVNLCRGEMSDFPGNLSEPLNLIGGLVAKRALSERRNIVTEVIGAEREPIMSLAAALNRAGYRIEVANVNCDLEESIKRNANRSENNISAYYTEVFHREWLMAACNEIEASASNV